MTIYQCCPGSQMDHRCLPPLGFTMGFLLKDSADLFPTILPSLDSDFFPFSAMFQIVCMNKDLAINHLVFWK